MSLGETDMEYKIPDHKISVDSVKTNNFFGPVIISSLFTNSEYTMANFGNSIPFSPAKYSLLFGVKTEISDSLAVVVKQMDKEIFNKVLRPKAIGKMNIERSRGDIKLLISDTSGYNYFIAGGFSHLLYEGLSEIKVQYDGNDKKFDLKTSWIEKPRVLNNPEYSIKLLGYIENENVVGELLSSDEEDYYKNLTEYWIKNYPADGMKFNYAMEEYYSRADYAIENFSSLNAFDGAERDRGKIYILYGPPTTTERNYTEMNEILEIWSYKNLARKFIFKDVNGTGKFDLTE
jgi:GWxTD domain-containing protein